MGSLRCVWQLMFADQLLHSHISLELIWNPISNPYQWMPKLQGMQTCDIAHTHHGTCYIVSLAYTRCIRGNLVSHAKSHKLIVNMQQKSLAAPMAHDKPAAVCCCIVAGAS